MEHIDILFVNSPSPNPSSILSHRIQGLPPLGIGYMATILNNNGYKSKILDFYLKEISFKNLKGIIEKQEPRIIGISSTTETYKNAIRLAKLIKNIDASIIIIFGGCHVTFEYEEALNIDEVDYVIRGEGEITILELCNYLLRGKGQLSQINGISYKEKGIIYNNADRDFIEDLDILPFPDRRLFSMRKYSVPASISTSRGCPGRCIFCAASALSGCKYRVRSAENIVEEFKYLNSLGYSKIQIVDDTMTADLRRLNKFLKLLIEEDLNITWGCESRVDIISLELLQKMYKAGCRSIQFGVEAGNQKMLDCLKKKISLEQVKRVFKWCKEVGIKSASCLIIGQPFDTKNSIKDTIEMGLELQRLGAQIVFSISTPYPGTYMYNNTCELGIEIVDFDTDNYTTQTPVYNTKSLTTKDIQNYFFEACMSISRHNIDNKLINRYKKIRDEAMNMG